MPSVTAYLDTRTKRKSGLYPIVIVVNHQGKQRFISTGHKITEAQWSRNRVVKHPSETHYNRTISEKIMEIDNYFAECSLKGRPVDLKLLGTQKTSYSFPEYIEHRAKQFDEAKKPVMHIKLMRLARELRDCFGEITFDEITPDKLRELENHMIGNGNSNNTRAGKFKFYGELLGQAVNDGKAFIPNHFKKHKIPKTEVTKEYLSKEEIERIESLEAAGQLAIFRDLFIFSFYCKGVRFTDCLLAKREQVQDGRIYFDTAKTGKKISVKIHAKLSPILNRYGGEFIFPLVKEIPSDELGRIRLSAMWNTMSNRHLKLIAAMCGIKKNLTFHMARHTFANQLKDITPDVYVIKESLGHSNIKTTEIYLRSLENRRLDQEMDKLYGE